VWREEAEAELAFDPQIQATPSRGRGLAMHPGNVSAAFPKERRA